MPHSLMKVISNSCILHKQLQTQVRPALSCTGRNRCRDLRTVMVSLSVASADRHWPHWSCWLMLQQHNVSSPFLISYSFQIVTVFQIIKPMIILDKDNLSWELWSSFIKKKKSVISSLTSQLDLSLWLVLFKSLILVCFFSHSEDSLVCFRSLSCCIT